MVVYGEYIHKVKYGENMWILFDKHEINNASIHDNISSNAKYVFYW
jgi:hypothetical protein